MENKGVLEEAVKRRLEARLEACSVLRVSDQEECSRFYKERADEEQEKKVCFGEW